MGTSLTGNNISASYLGLLKSTDSLAIGGTKKIITDGAGNDLPFGISTSSLTFNAGAVDVPTLSIGTINEGFYQPTDETIGVSINGSEVARFLSTGLSLTSSKLTLSNDQKIRWTSDDVYIQGTTSADNIQIGVGGSTQFTFAQTTGMRLHQYGSGSITGTVTQRLGVTSTGQVVEIPIGAGALDGSGTAGKIAKFTDSDTLGDSIMSESGSTIEIAGGGGNGQLNLTRTSGVTLFHQAQASVGVVGTSTNHRLDLKTNSTTALTISTSQLVGIGTTSPSQPLSVAGNVDVIKDAGNNTLFHRIHNQGTATNDDAVLTWQTQASRHFSMGIHRDSGLLTISNLDASVSSGELMTMDLNGVTTFAGNLNIADTKKIIFGGTASSGDDSASISFNDSTGILNVTASSADSHKVQICGDTIEAVEGGTATFANGATVQSALSVDSVQTIGSGTTMSLGTSAGNVMTLLNSNLGVNVTSPTTAKLVVAGDVNTFTLRVDGYDTTNQSFGARIRAGTSSSDTALLVENTSASELFKVAGDGNATFVGDITLSTDSDILKLGTNPFRLFTNGSLALSVSASQNATFSGDVTVSGGNLGVGLTASSFALEVETTGNNGIKVNTGSSGAEELYMGNTGGEASIGLLSNHNLQIIQNGSIAIAIDTSKNATFASDVNIATDSATSSGKLTIQSQGANGSDETALVLRNYSASPFTGFVTTEFEIGTINIAELSARRIDSNNGELIFRTKQSGTISETIRLDSSGNVGIGTTTPNHLLDVESAGASMRLFNTTSDGDTEFYISTTGTTGASKILFGDTADADIGKIIYRHNGNSMAFETNDSEAMRILSDGKVGIGTTSPSNLLEIDGGTGVATTGTLVLRQNGDTASSGLSITSSHATSHRIWKDASGNLNIGSSADPDAFQQDTSGNATFAGKILASNDAPAFAFASDTETGMARTGTHQIAFKNNDVDSLTLAANLSATFAGDVTVTGGDVTLGTNSIASSLNSLGDVLSINVDSDADGAVTANLQFKISNSEKMRLNNTGLGIGLNSYTSPLAIKSNSVSTQNSGLSIQANGSTDDIIRMGEKSTNGGRLHMFDGGTEKIAFYTDGTNNHISAGNVGIGTNNPLNKLHVSTSDDVTALFQSTDSISRIEFADNNTTGSTRPSIGASGNNTIFTQGSTERMRLDSSGQLGLGTTAPVNKLSIVGSANTGMNIQAGSSNIAYVDFGDSDDTNFGGINYNNADDTLNLRAGNTNKLTITSSGNVGIGTDSPSTKLHVTDGGTLPTISGTYLISATSASNAGIQINAGNTSASIVAFGDTDSQDVGVIRYDHSDNHMRFDTNGTERMRITSDGRLGIGVTVPSYRLEILGDSQVVARFKASNNSTSTNNGGALIDIQNTDSTNGNQCSLIFRDSNGNGSSGIFGYHADHSDGEGFLTFGTRNSSGTFSQRMKITQTGEITLTNSDGIRLSPQNSQLYSADGSLSYYGTDNAVYLNGAGTNGWLRLQASGVENNRNAINIYGGGNVTPDDTIDFRTAGSERARITSGGDVLVGTTSEISTGNGFSITNTGQVRIGRASTGIIKQIVFSNPNDEVGSISTSGSATAYNTSSDYRLKEDLKDFNALEIASKIKMYDFKWKADDTRSYGVMAHELQEVVPQAVSGDKDDQYMQQVDYSKLVPILLKSIQELEARVKELEKEI